MVHVRIPWEHHSKHGDIKRMMHTIVNGKQVRLVVAALLLSACGQGKLKAGLNVGLAGADVGNMAASEVRMSKAAKGKRFETRIAAQRALAKGTLTPQILRASVDSFVTDEKVAVVVSRFLQQEEIAAASNFKSQGLPFLSVTPLQDGIASANGPGFSLVPSLAKQAAFLASQAKADDRVAIVHIDNAYGVNLARAVSDALKARGITPVDIRQYEQNWDEPRVVALGAELERQKDPTLLLFLGRAPSLQLIWQPFRDAAKEIRVVGSDLVESTALYANPDGAFTGLLYVRYFNPQDPETRMHDLHERYAMWIGRGEMTGEAVLVYDAIGMIGEALRSGARTRKEIQQYLASLGRSRPPYKGVGGLTSFDESGEAKREFQLALVTNRGVVPAEQ
jgi:ABC-type branched-subunit amino acid transport system substrate-binding protein